MGGGREKSVFVLSVGVLSTLFSENFINRTSNISLDQPRMELSVLSVWGQRCFSFEVLG